MTKKLNWRLAKLPTPDEVRELLKDKIITNEEAREILFSSEDEKDRDKKSLESEIKFLRELCTELGKTKHSMVEAIRIVENPIYKKWDWYGSTVTFLSSANTVSNPDIALCGGGTFTGKEKYTTFTNLN